MYDKDGSGSIDLPEMIEIIGTLYEMEGVSKVRRRFQGDPQGKLDKTTFPEMKNLIRSAAFQNFLAVGFAFSCYAVQ